MGDFLKGLGGALTGVGGSQLMGGGGLGKIPLFGILGQALMGGSGQDDAMSQDEARKSADGDAHAKSLGFRDREQMLNWARQRNNATGGTIPTAGPADQNAHDLGPMMMHPKNLLDYVGKKWQEAMGGQ